MKRTYWITGMLAVLPLVSHAVIKVVTTLPDLKSIAEAVGGDKVSVTSIAKGYQNPHFVDPKPSYIIRLSRADLFVTVGLDLETGWAPSLLQSSRNPKIQKGAKGYVDASDNIPLLQVPNSISRQEGDIHIYGNPHYWLDPQRGKIIAGNICKGLIRVAPEHKAYFEQRLEVFRRNIDEKDLQWKQAMRRYHGLAVIAYHNEWCYFETHFGFKILDFLEPKPGIPPTPSQLVKVIRLIRENHIRLIITSPYFPAKSAEVVARQTGAKVLVLATSVGAFDGIDTYFDLFDYNIRKFTQSLK